MVFLYLAKPHCTPHHLCFTNSRFHQTPKQHYFHASKFTSQRVAPHCHLQRMIRLISTFFISGTPVPYHCLLYTSPSLFHIIWNIIPYHLEHCSISSGITLHLSATTLFYFKTQRKKWKIVMPNIKKQEKRDEESQI